MPTFAERIRRGPASARLRITLLAVALVAVALGIAAVGAVRLLHTSLTTDQDEVLVDRADDVEALAQAGDLAAVIPTTGRETGQLQVVDQRGTVVAATTGITTANRLDVIDAPPMGQQRAVTVHGLRVLARTVPSAGGALTIYAASSLSAAERAEDHFERVLMIGVPVLLLLTALLIWWVVGRALAPVDEMRRTVDRIAGEARGERVTVRRDGDEIGRLGLTLNRMLDRVDDAAQRQQVFAAAASHELRSPLSAIRTELEVGLTYPDRTDWTTVAGESLVEVQRLEHLATDLLRLARLQSADDGHRTTEVDLAQVARSELARRRRDGLTHHEELRGATVDGDPDLVVQLCRNLFDNAERHAATRLVVSTGTAGPAGVLRVWNDGPTIGDEDRERIFHPFTRLDDARTLDAGGSGLGLAIARAICEQLGGTLICAAVEHGAAFEATFPATGRVGAGG